MATSVYFNNYAASNEQGLIEDLIAETFKMYGIDVYYCPRTIVAKDELYGEDAVSEYRSSYMLEMYLKSVDGFEGDGQFLSKFGLQIRDQVTFSVSARTFGDEVKYHTAQSRPNEGDLIYLTLNPDRPQLYQIKYVNDRSIMYQLGALEVYDLVCEVFEYSSEKLDTGIAEIDAIETTYSADLRFFDILTGDGSTLITGSGDHIIQSQYDLDAQLGNDSWSDNEFLETEADEFIDFTETDPFSEGGSF